MLPHRLKQLPADPETNDNTQQAADVGIGGVEEEDISRNNTPTEAALQVPDQQTLPSTASSSKQAKQAVAGNKRKWDDDGSQPDDRHKRQTFDLPFRGPAVPPRNGNLTSHVDNAPGTSSSSTQRAQFLGALFAVVSTNRTLRLRWELYQDCRKKCKRRCRVVESFEAGVQSVQEKTYGQYISQQHLSEMGEYQAQLKIFIPERDESQQKTGRLLREHDGLRDEVEASVEGLFVYDKSLRDEQALQLLAKDGYHGSFWDVFEARQLAAKTAAENAKTAMKAIEDERRTIRSRMDAHSKQILLVRLARVNSMDGDANAPATSAETGTRDTTEQDLRRLSDLVFEERNLKYKEKFKDVKDLRLQSEKLLKLAERAFVDAKLLPPDGNENFRGGWYEKPKRMEAAEDTETDSSESE